MEVERRHLKDGFRHGTAEDELLVVAAFVW